MKLTVIHLLDPKTNLVKNNEIRRLPLQNEYACKHYIKKITLFYRPFKRILSGINK